MPQFEMECGPRCRSRGHALDINASVSKGNLAEVQAYCRLCYNGGQKTDRFSRTALHLAASCGKTDIVEWLLEEKHADVTQRDAESGWTAMHRAVFYGQLASAVMLAQYKSDLYTRDHEGLGPLDIVMKDRALQAGLPPAVYDMKDRHEVYTWGDNSNFTLGHTSEHRRSGPEVVDEFRKLGLSFKQIVMCKYHTVFLTQDGLVYTCGHGQGGRLGHSSEETCLVPKQIDGLNSEVVTQLAAARDHTVFITQSHHVYSCGLNEHHQLGLSQAPDKCLVPKLITTKVLRGKTILGVCAGRFHTVLYTRDCVFTFGLNAGQLGHAKLKNDRRISQPRQVSFFNHKDILVSMVACSDAATVVLTDIGDIYVLHEYQCRKIASKWQEIVSLQVIGGNLDHTDSQVLRENGGKELVISLLNQSGRVFVWRVSSPSLKRAHWLIKRQLFVKDYVFTESNLIIVTTDGEAFSCTLTNKSQPIKAVHHSSKESNIVIVTTDGEAFSCTLTNKSQHIKAVHHTSKELKDDNFGRISLMDLLLQDETEEVQVRRIPNIHRASYITADRKGRNFASLQSLPNCSLTDVPFVSGSEMIESFTKLLDEADEYDTIHDIVLQCNGHCWPAHRFVLMSRCSNFQGLLNKYSDNNNNSEISTLNIPDMHPQIVEQLLKFVYTDSCDLFTIGAKFSLAELKREEDIFHMDIEANVTNSGDNKLSAFAVNEKLKKSNQQGTDDFPGQSKDNPVKIMQDAARKWGIKGLAKRLEAVKYSRGQIVSAGKQLQKPKLRFNRNKYRDSKLELYDVSIQSEDGEMFHCHKCVLVARLEYFHSMLASGWMETSSSTALTLPIPGDILEILLDFLYTDESDFVSNCQNVELLCNILVVADQMLVIRLKEICEAAIATLITLRNVGELLEFATMYNADQLRSACQQYIAINLAVLLEARLLDVLSDGVMEELVQYYRNLIPNMSRRVITPFDEGPEKWYLESLVKEEPPLTPLGGSLEPKKQKSKRKRQRTKSSNEDYEGKGHASHGPRRGSERQLSISSDISAKSEEELTDVIEILSVEENLEETGKNIKVVVPTLNLSVLKSQPSPEGYQERKPVVSPPLAPSGAWSAPRDKIPPQSPGDAASLRDIMEQEKPDKILSNERKSKKFSWKDVKKQQQKQQQQQQQHQQQVPENGNTSQMEKSPQSASCPWGAVNKVVESFRSLMVEDQVVVGKQTGTQAVKSKTGSGGRQTGPPAVKSKTGSGERQTGPISNVVSWGLPKSSSRPPSQNIQIKSPQDPRAVAGSISPRSPGNPWLGLAQSPPEPSFSFTDIVEDERKKTDVLTKASNKPLGLIQMEEQAIQDLLLHYRAAANVDELITVERVPQVAATPLWKRERLTST